MTAIDRSRLRSLLDAERTAYAESHPRSAAAYAEAQRWLATNEGVFCEPASAASVAGALKHGVGGAKRLVCVITGHGLKDPDIALQSSAEVVNCDVDYGQIEQAVLGD